MDLLSKSLQENILTLLCFNDKYAPLIATNIDSDLFESSIYRDIASQAKAFVLEFKKPIGEHLPDSFEHILNKGDSKASLYTDVLSSLYEFRDKINPDYTIKNLSKFLYQQNLKLGIKEAVELLQEGKLEEAEAALEKGKSKSLNTFDVGTRFGKDINRTLQFFKRVETSILTGIKELDILTVCPTSKELYTFAGISGSGKSWYLIHLAKMALLQKKRVLYITLEMSEEMVSQRLIQSLFSVSKRRGIELFKPVFHLNEHGHLCRITHRHISDRPSLHDTDIRKFLRLKLEKLKNPQIIIKEFPTGQLTVPMFESYLTNLENYFNFVPELVLFDSPDLMKLNTRDLRVDTGRVMKEVRGIAVDRYLAMVAAAQLNRESKKLRWATSGNLAEDFSKLMISDNLVVYNQTNEEYQYGLARLFNDKVRNDKGGSKTLIAQNYSIGQFCLGSTPMNDRDIKLIDEVVSDKQTSD